MNRHIVARITLKNEEIELYRTDLNNISLDPKKYSENDISKIVGEMQKWESKFINDLKLTPYIYSNSYTFLLNIVPEVIEFLFNKYYDIKLCHYIDSGNITYYIDNNIDKAIYNHNKHFNE